ncbi:MAG: DUF1549 domain-containing protein [Deltaproteobacteria bacterium]|nr:DUF1549 domain-containing protein [Deltaproteobacteria bacterium]
MILGVTAFIACRTTEASRANAQPAAGSPSTMKFTATAGTEALAAKVDGMLARLQSGANLKPAPIIDDATFLRRVTLDLTGTLPEPDAVRAFLADQSLDKRAKAVDALLASPAYAQHWAAYWGDLLLPLRAQKGIIDRGAFHRWLLHRFNENAGYNQWVFDLVSATGQNSIGGEEALPRNTGDIDDTREAQAGVNGAVNWLLQYREAPQDLAGNTSRIFLGVQIQCAQCHDHKTEKWKQTDFRKFAAAFARTQDKPMDGKSEMKGIKRIEVRDINHPVRMGPKAPPEWRDIAMSRPTALDGTDLDHSDMPRRALAGWIVSDKNPWFATELVNRYWGALTGRGFVDPVDDLRPSNPTMAPEAQDALAQDFITHGYDLKRLLRTICLTNAYQRSVSGEQPKGDDFWARGRLRPLSAEQLLNSIVAATHLEPVLEERAGKQGKSVNLVKFQLQRDVTFLFDVDEAGGDDDTFTGTVPQALMLLNGGLVNRAVKPVPGATLEEAMSKPDDAARVELLYLRTLSRLPTPEERKAWASFVADASDGAMLRGRARRESYEDLFWALLNSSEFQFNH